MNVNQSPSASLSQSVNDSLHDRRIIKDETHFEHSVPESYHHSSYASTIVEESNNQLAPSTNLSSHQRTSSPSQKYSNKHIKSSSHGPTSYRYPSASIIDESTLNTYSINQSSHQQQLSRSSPSAYVPQHHNTNRHPLLATTSDDSGNESSVNYQQQIANNTHFVVVAIDFGTTFSGYAFAFTRDIDSILMMRKVDGNDPGSLCFVYFFFFMFLFCYQYFSFLRCN